MRQRHPRASISNAFERHLEHILSKAGRVETTILRGSGHAKQALERLCVSFLCHFYVHVFGTGLFQDLFHNCVTCRAFVCPFLHHFGHHFVIISTFIFRPRSHAIIGWNPLARQSPWRNRKGEGGTWRRHDLGGIMGSYQGGGIMEEASGRMHQGGGIREDAAGRRRHH